METLNLIEDPYYIYFKEMYLPMIIEFVGDKLGSKESIVGQPSRKDYALYMLDKIGKSTIIIYLLTRYGINFLDQICDEIEADNHKKIFNDRQN